MPLPLEEIRALTMVPWVHRSRHAKRHLDLFSHFSTAQRYARQTDRHAQGTEHRLH